MQVPPRFGKSPCLAGAVVRGVLLCGAFRYVSGFERRRGV